MEPPSTHQSLLDAMRTEPRCEGAWHTFMERYTPLIHSWCARWVLRDDIEDLAQEIALKLVDSLPTYDRQRGRFCNWLAIVVRNTAVDLLRAQRPGDRGVGGDGWRAGLEDLPAPVDIAASLEHGIGEELKQVCDQVAHRAPASWRAFAMRNIEGRPAKEVARELSIAVGAVYQACYYVREMLKKELKPTPGEGPTNTNQGPSP